MELLLLYLIILGIMSFTYFAFAAFVILISKKSNKKIQPKEVSSKDKKREILYSIYSLIIFSSVVTWLYVSYLKGETALYNDYDKYGIFYLVASFFILVFAHDFYFYFTHRLMHIKGLYTKIHRVHHLSNSPNALTAFSFHPLEAIIQIIYLPLAVYLIPAYWPILLLQFFYGFYVINIVGHSGYAYFSKIFTTGFFNYIAVTPAYHDIHHKLSKTNFGLYTPTWDKILHTFQSIHQTNKPKTK